MAKCNTEQDWFCCPGDADCSCDTGKNAVKLGDSQPSTVTVIGSTSWPGITSTTSPFVQTSPLVTEGTTTGDASGAVTSGGSSTTPTLSNTDIRSSTGTGTAATALDTSSAPVQSSGSGSSGTGLAAGLGAGLGAAAVLIGVLIFFLIRSRRRRNAKKLAVGDGYGNVSSSGDPMMQKPFYGGQPMSAYSDSQQYIATGAPAPNYKPELPGGGEHNRAEMPTDGNGGTFPRRATDRAELAS